MRRCSPSGFKRASVGSVGSRRGGGRLGTCGPRSDANHGVGGCDSGIIGGVTCRLVTPWLRHRDRPAVAAEPVWGGTEPTRMLDWRSPEVADVLADLAVAGLSGRGLLQQAHALIASRVVPTYAVDERQSASRTLRLGRGSCSQRLAVLEAVARGSGIRTRVRGLLVDGSFWYPRFPRLRFAVPDVVVLAWPEFWLEKSWVSASELFGPVGSSCAAGGFTNVGGETLFDAIRRTAVDWDGKSSVAGAAAICDLSGAVTSDLGFFNSRDELFARHGQTMCWGVRALAGPFLGRWSAGAAPAA